MLGRLRVSRPAEAARPSGSGGALIVNADDWGRDSQTTDRTLDCVLRGAVSSVSAMVYMEDSERAAGIARQEGVDAGLHLNFTAPFSCSRTPAQLKERHRKIATCLLRHRLAPALFHPALKSSFEYVAAAQMEEFQRLYGEAPRRIDGHHHMHLCANVVLGGLLPRGTSVRRNFSFGPGEKGPLNRWYRRFNDGVLSRRHALTDYFFSIVPLDPPARLERIAGLAERFVVEVETHPAHPDEYRFLAGGEIFRRLKGIPIAPHFAM